MRGRIFGIKKSFILTSVFVALAAGFIALCPITIFLLGFKTLWFFILCGCCGIYQILKGAMFKFDSAFYFGTLLLGICATGFYTQFSGISTFEAVYYILSFAAASYLTYVFFGQKFHLYLSILLYFNAFSWLLTKIKLF